MGVPSLLLKPFCPEQTMTAFCSALAPKCPERVKICEPARQLCFFLMVSHLWRVPCIACRGDAVSLQHFHPSKLVPHLYQIVRNSILPLLTCPILPGGSMPYNRSSQTAISSCTNALCYTHPLHGRTCLLSSLHSQSPCTAVSRHTAYSIPNPLSAVRLI